MIETRIRPSRGDLTLVDVRDARVLALLHFDVAFWWHGPEHVTREELPEVVAGLKKRRKAGG